MLKMILVRENYELDQHHNGNNLFPVKEPFPKLFLLDNNLGNVSGLDICRKLKSNPLTASIPVIIMSASPDLPLLAQQAGADGWLEKPFELSVLHSLIRHHTLI